MSQSPVSAEEWYHDLGTKYVVAQILFHFNATGVIRDLETHAPTTSAEIAGRLSLDAGILDVLLFYLSQAETLIELDTDKKYRFTPFGQEILKRYSRRDTSGTTYNFHEVRVGALGPVWAEIGGMLRGTRKYGVDFKRRGEYAEDGVYAQAKKFAPALLSAVARLRPSEVIEIGANTGITEQLGAAAPAARLHVVDRSRDSLDRAAGRFARNVAGRESPRWIEADFFKPAAWLEGIAPGAPLLIHSIHFHEVLAAGEDALVKVLGELRALGHTGHVLAMEQPSLPPEERAGTARPLWLYNHSNILIHHLIGNGRILSAGEWTRVFERGGCRLESVMPVGFLGYQAFCFAF